MRASAAVRRRTAGDHAVCTRSPPHLDSADMVSGGAGFANVSEAYFRAATPGRRLGAGRPGGEAAGTF